MLPLLPPVLAQAVPAPSTSPTEPLIQREVLTQPVQRACGVADPNAFCRWVFEETGNPILSRLAGQIIPGALKILLVLVLAAVATALIRRLVRRYVVDAASESLSRWQGLHEIAQPRSGRAQLRLETIAGVGTSIATAVVWATAALMVLGVFNINLGPFIAGAGIIGIALGFGAQSLVRDFLSGGFMLVEDQYGVGDIVDVGEAAGVVEAITLRTTRLRDVEGTVWHVPNGEIRRVGNKSQQWARSLLDIAVAYDTPIDKASAVIKGVADDLWRDAEWADQILDEPELWGVENFGPSEIVIRLVVKTEPARQWAVNRELRSRLKAAFDETGIEIPFPQRSVWIRDAG